MVLGNTTDNRQGGFSLGELLVVIGVIGLIAAIALPQFTKISDSVDSTVAKRNAQTIAAVTSAAQAAGDVTLAESATIDDVIAKLSEGVSGAGVFDDKIFKVELTANETAAAIPFLSMTAGSVYFEGARDAVPTHETGSTFTVEVDDEDAAADGTTTYSDDDYSTGDLP